MQTAFQRYFRDGKNVPSVYNYDYNCDHIIYYISFINFLIKSSLLIDIIPSSKFPENFRETECSKLCSNFGYLLLSIRYKKIR